MSTKKHGTRAQRAQGMTAYIAYQTGSSWEEVGAQRGLTADEAREAARWWATVCVPSESLHPMPWPPVRDARRRAA